jgi:AraC family transcriptional regulator
VLAEPDPNGLAGLYGESVAAMMLSELARLRGKPAPRAGALSARQAQRVIDYLDANLDAEVTLADLAALVHLSPGHFSTLFKGAVGMTPHQCLITRRIARAKALLADKRKPITDIALECGFASPSHFSASFRRHVGTSPTNWTL